MKELETLEELKDYELLHSEAHKVFYGIVYHYLYKGLFNNAHISYVDKDKGKHWLVSMCTGDDLDNFEELGFVYTGFSRGKAMEKAKDILGRVRGDV